MSTENIYTNKENIYTNTENIYTNTENIYTNTENIYMSKKTCLAIFINEYVPLSSMKGF